MISPLSIKNISKAHRDQVVLRNLNLQLKSGEIFALVGLNGAGKTTLIKIILDLIHSDSGFIALSGICSVQSQARDNLAYLPECFSAPSYLKVNEFLFYMLGLYQQPICEIELSALLCHFALDEAFLNKRVTTLSKGTMQKVGLILMLLSQKPLLLLDEPMSGLDPLSRMALKTSLRELKQRGQTVLFSSHLLLDVEQLCDRIGILHHGELLFCGSVEQCLAEYEADNMELAFLAAVAGVGD
ncbi:MAG: ABC transporter ATP-binding protein [Gammaproteobacteria bacterium]|nr:ABC transporter ATP-binding protein [Gammaproteobacteria bacterium]